jgi:hypothetical protein
LPPARRANYFQGPHLVEQVVAQLVSGHRDVPATEAVQIAVTDPGADRNTILDGQGAGTSHDAGVTAVESAGDVGAGDDLE